MIFERIKNNQPDLFDMTIMASVLHSFYNGLENIFEIIARNIDENVPTGNRSHKELLYQMVSKNDKRNCIINQKLYLKLKEYATFRQFYRHTYSYQLKWEKLQPLICDVQEVWQDTKQALLNIHFLINK